MEFISLGSLIYDILNIIRGAQISDDEPISEKQIEAWIHQYRALFIKRDLDKGKTINPDYVQSIDDVTLEYDPDRNMYRTSIDIPEALDLNHKSGIIFVGDIYGNRIQLMPWSRINYQQYSRFTNDDTVAFLHNHRLYIYNSKGLEAISVRGIFQIPNDAYDANGDTFTYESYYPIPLNIVAGLKQEILKNELGIEYSAPNDNINNSTNDLSSDLQGYKQTYRTNRTI